MESIFEKLKFIVAVLGGALTVVAAEVPAVNGLHWWGVLIAGVTAAATALGVYFVPNKQAVADIDAGVASGLKTLNQVRTEVVLNEPLANAFRVKLENALKTQLGALSIDVKTGQAAVHAHLDAAVEDLKARVAPDPEPAAETHEPTVEVPVASAPVEAPVVAPEPVQPAPASVTGNPGEEPPTPAMVGV